jgi:hypothetical protein
MVAENGLRFGGRVILALLTLYALAIIVPDFARIIRPLGSFGLSTNADGLIYDVQGPFAEEDSPAWRAGVRQGDRLDLAAMRCAPVNTEVCASNLALWGGVTYVMPGRTATLLLKASAGRPAREVRLIARPPPRSLALHAVLLLDEIAGVLVVLGAAYLVWIRPGPMTWGFFAYSLYFNPAQWFQFYAWLQQWPALLLIQDAISCILQAAGYTGLLLFALRAPVDRCEGRWRKVERALPALFVLFLAIALASLGSIFGYPTELAMQSSILLGFAVCIAALAILVGRRGDLSPRDYQRIRWVIWGCLIGLPAYLIAEVSQETSLPASLLGADVITEDMSGFFYLVNGVLWLFVVEAVRRPTVVSVWIPLRRATALGLLLSIPAFLIHEELGTVNELTQLPEWAWVLLASLLVFAISRLHESATELLDRLFDRHFLEARRRLAAAGEAVHRAESVAEIDRLLVNEPTNALRLASAALFSREEGQLFRRRTSIGWDAAGTDTLSGSGPVLGGKLDREAFALDGIGGIDPSDSRFPHEVERPLLGVRVGNPRQCFAIALYSGHVVGTALDDKERGLLVRLAHDAAIAYAHIDRERLRQRVETLEGHLARLGASPGQDSP